MSDPGGLTHFDAAGKAVMVDVSDKRPTRREAVAEGEIVVGRAIFDAIRAGTAEKGDVLGAARLAGIMAAKRTADLIPLCHPLPVSRCGIAFDLDARALAVRARCSVRTTARTGVEMEALTAVSIAALTVYDMCKAVQKDMVISDIRLLSKTGGKSGNYVRSGENEKR